MLQQTSQADHTAPPATRLAILIPFAIVTLIWGSTWLVIRDQVSSVPPSWSVTYRFLVAGIAMTATARIRRELELAAERRVRDGRARRCDRRDLLAVRFRLADHRAQHRCQCFRIALVESRNGCGNSR